MMTQPVFIISGKQGEGKTTVLTEVIHLLEKEGLSLKGFTAPGEWEDKLRTEFGIKDISSSSFKLLCKGSYEEGFEKIGRFYFDPSTISFGEEMLLSGAPGDLIIIDEVGRFETMGMVWSNSIKHLIKNSKNPMIFTVRDQFVSDVIRHFQILKPVVFNINEGPVNISTEIISNLSTS